MIDNTAFALPPEDPGAFDGRPNRTYNVLPDALMVNFQSIEFRVAPNAQTGKVEVAATPAPVNLAIDNRIALRRAIAARRRIESISKSPPSSGIASCSPARCRAACAERSITRVLLNPPQYAFGTFVELWRQLGGEFSGALRVEAAPPDAQPYLDFDSLSLGEIVRLTNKFSSNLMARHLLLTMGEERFGAPATTQKGADAIALWARERGLDLQEMDIDNGSGLSRSTRISVSQMATSPERGLSQPLRARVHRLAAARRDRRHHAMPRMQQTPAGSVRLKTGHLDGVSGVAGYVTTASGKSFVLVSLVNDLRSNAGAGDAVHAALVAWMQENL